ncbi:serine hydrolase domain-containing protein [Actinomadura rugatobispora]|uniref:Serine hydrolase domain-containing protein n=1 Tax=Actinomadura rugatobispora TaxID=1994 RepID=A0ABW1AFL7_9ACTN|nr:serine hydrolase [Actinomadura rugatobispora]
MNGNGGFSKRRLDRMREVMTGHVEAGRVPGAVTLLARHGEVLVDAIGSPALGGAEPIHPGTIFRISSMSKPVTAVAALILVEECRLRLDEPVDRLLPELADRRVLRAPDAEVDDTVPAHRPITVRDLLDFRCGLGMIFEPEAFGYPIYRAAQELGVTGFGPPDPRTPHSPDEWARLVGTLPLVCQPGERWLYNTGSYLLSVLVARASGQPFEAFLRERIFEPLGMKDTGFSVPAAELDRLATAYQVAEDGTLREYDSPRDSGWARPPAFPDGGGGLVSTAGDYLAFAGMLLGKGTYRGERVLSRPAVELMTSDQLTGAQRREAFGDASSWGLGVSVALRRDRLSTTPGRYGWDGGLGTSWYNDPAEDLVAILMTQRAEFPDVNPVWLDFWTGVYQAIDD